MGEAGNEATHLSHNIKVHVFNDYNDSSCNWYLSIMATLQQIVAYPPLQLLTISWQYSGTPLNGHP